MGEKSVVPASYDLHLHTCWSCDATAEPEMYFRRAREIGVRLMAITDHNNFDSTREVLAEAEEYPEIRIIIAAELTADTSIGSVDLLCYNLPLVPTDKLARAEEWYMQWYRDRIDALSKGMEALGYKYTSKERAEILQSYRPERVLAKQGTDTPVRSGALRKYFLENRLVASEEEYDTLMAKLKSVVREPSPPPAGKIVPAVKEAGGLVVIAHPAGHFLGDDVSRMDTLRKEIEFDGIECAHPKVAPELTAFYRAYCRRNGLVSTGGTDSHHPENILTTPAERSYTAKNKFACHIGEDNWIEELLERF